MRIHAPNFPQPTPQIEAPRRTARAGNDRSGVGGVPKAASAPAPLAGADQLSGSISALLQSARSGGVSTEEFDQRLSDIAGQLISPDMSALDKGRATHLVARMAGLENQLVQRLQGTGGEQPNTIDQQIIDWANRFAAANGATLHAGSGNGQGALLERKI